MPALTTLQYQLKSLIDAYRIVMVGHGRSARYVLPSEVGVTAPLEARSPVMPRLIEERFNQLLSKASAIRNPFEQTFFVMVQLPYLQPFDDVNKRVSRLAANIPLIRANLVPVSF